jgi:hypothetical protein
MKQWLAALHRGLRRHGRGLASRTNCAVKGFVGGLTDFVCKHVHIQSRVPLILVC